MQKREERAERDSERGGQRESLSPCGAAISGAPTLKGALLSRLGGTRALPIGWLVDLDLLRGWLADLNLLRGWLADLDLRQQQGTTDAPPSMCRMVVQGRLLRFRFVLTTQLRSTAAVGPGTSLQSAGVLWDAAAWCTPLAEE